MRIAKGDDEKIHGLMSLMARRTSVEDAVKEIIGLHDINALKGTDVTFEAQLKTYLPEIEVNWFVLRARLLVCYGIA